MQHEACETLLPWGFYHECHLSRRRRNPRRRSGTSHLSLKAAGSCVDTRPIPRPANVKVTSAAAQLPSGAADRSRDINSVVGLMFWWRLEILRRLLHRRDYEVERVGEGLRNIPLHKGEGLTRPSSRQSGDLS